MDGHGEVTEDSTISSTYSTTESQKQERGFFSLFQKLSSPPGSTTASCPRPASESLTSFGWETPSCSSWPTRRSGNASSARCTASTLASAGTVLSTCSGGCRTGSWRGCRPRSVSLKPCQVGRSLFCICHFNCRPSCCWWAPTTMATRRKTSPEGSRRSALSSGTGSRRHIWSCW